MTIRCGFREDGNVARAPHFAAHPEDRGANVAIYHFYDDEEMADESQDSAPCRLGGMRGTLKAASGSDAAQTGSSALLGVLDVVCGVARWRV